MDTLNTILETQKALEKSFSQRFIELDSKIKSASPVSHPTISSLSKEVGCFKEQVSSMLQLLRQQILAVSNTVDAIEMRHRKKFLIFSGLPEVAGEDIANSIATMCQTKLHLEEVSPDTISVCYRLGVSSNDRPRSVLVRFKDHQLRSSVWSSKKALKGSSVVITEFLTRQRQTLFIDARKHFGMRSVWSMDGNIYIKLPSGKKERVTSDEQLHTLKSEYAPVAHCKPARGAESKPTSTAAPEPAPAPAPAILAESVPRAAAPAKEPEPGPARKADDRSTRVKRSAQ